MDYSQYFVVPARDKARVIKLFDPMCIIDDGKFIIAVSEDQKLAKKLDLVLDFNNDEWSAWGFALFRKGKVVAEGLFGENLESGVSFEDNCLEGDLDKMAELLEVSAAKLKRIVESEDPDVDAFIKLVGFGRYSITPYDIERAKKQHAKEKKAAKKKKTAKKKSSTSKKR
jgi:hypothetical protein